MPANSDIQEIQGVIVGVEPRKVGEGAKRYTLQKALLRELSGAEIVLTVWNHDPIDPLVGQELMVIGQGAGSITVVHDTFKGRTKVELKVQKSAQFHTLATGARIQADKSPAKAVPSPVEQRSATNNAYMPPKASGAYNAEGARLGMAMKLAGDYLISVGGDKDSFPVALKALTREIVKISRELEAE